MAPKSRIRLRRSARTQGALLGLTLMAVWAAALSISVVPAGAASSCVNGSSTTGVDDNNRKCINTDGSGNAVSPYSGFMRLPDATSSLGDEVADHVPGGGQHLTITGD